MNRPAGARSLVYEYYLLICRPGPQADRPEVLLIPDPAQGADPHPGWTLPWFQQKEHRFWQEVAHINQAAADRLGLRAATLRCLHTHYDPAQDRVQAIYALESLDPVWKAPAGARWVNAQDLARTPDTNAASLTVAGHGFTQPVVADAVAAWFSDHATADSPADKTHAPARVPWYTPGWFASAETWIEQALQSLGRTPSAPVVQVRSWQRSCLLQVETDGGPVFLKAVPPIFAHEPAITHALSDRYPRHIPPVLARHPRQPWFLMQAVPGDSLETCGDPAVWEQAVRTFALIQIDLAQRTQRLVELGCPVRPLSTLADRFEQLLADESALLLGRPAGLNEDDLETIRAMLPELRRKAQRLSEIDLPPTLEHGDFWPGQVLVAQDPPPPPSSPDPGAALTGPRPVFIDWSDCSIAHPFFSLSFFDDIMEMEGYLPDVDDLRERLRTAYLGPWSTFAPMKELVEAFELARPLAAIHNALIYQQQILPGMQQRWEMHYMPPFFLKKLLHNYDRAVVV